MTLPTKLSEMIKNHFPEMGCDCGDPEDGPCEMCLIRYDFEAGARATLALPEVQALLEALNYYSDKSNWDHGDVPGHSYIVDSDRGITARRAIAQWHQFTNSNKGGGE